MSPSSSYSFLSVFFSSKLFGGCLAGSLCGGVSEGGCSAVHVIKHGAETESSFNQTKCLFSFIAAMKDELLWKCFNATNRSA